MPSTVITELERKIVVNPGVYNDGAHLALEDTISGELVEARLTEQERQALIEALQNPNLDAPTAKVLEASRYGIRCVLVQDIRNDELYWADSGSSFTAEEVSYLFFDIAIIKE